MRGTGRRYWRSLDELADKPEFREWLHREFPEHASELLGRRTLLKLMAASFGLAGLTACRRPEEKILPASKGVEDHQHGNPLRYATVMASPGSAVGLLVECHDGRPTKIEGNPNHPASLGACSAFAQAAILGLYDPDRSRTPLRHGNPASWEEFEKAGLPAVSGEGEGLRFLSERVVSPSLEAVRAHALSRFAKARWVEYEPVSNDASLAGAGMAFGRPLQPHYRFDRADVVLSLDDDFLGMDAPHTVYTRDFARRRRLAGPKDSMNRLYVVESRYSITGAMADHRLRLRPGEIPAFAASLLAGSPDGKWAAAVARDLAAHRGRSLVVVGPRQPAEVHAAAHWLNQRLGNIGETVTFTRTIEESWRPQLSALKELAGEMARGQVAALVILGGNPAFTAPADLDFAAHLKKVAVSIHLGLEVNETAALAAWHLPEAHFLESWGDARALDGTVSIQQPLIEPLFGGKTAAEVLALLSGYKDRRSYDIVRNYWQSQWPAAAREERWRRALHDGLVEGTRFPEVKPVANPQPPAVASRPADGVEVTFYPSASVWDGRFANNGWLQEAPEPMTKLTWDNAALLSPATAKSMGVATGDLLALEAGGRRMTAPALIQPGHADGAISIALGYGRTRCGRVGRGVGHNAYALRTSDAPHTAGNVAVRKTGRKYPLACTQEHHSMEGRPLVREAPLEEYRKHPDFARHAVHHPPLFSLYGEHRFDQGNQWGMVIDLNACVGCNACLVACQAENNIPIVGKQQVMRGREMHWIRMDRYYQGEENDPQVVYQPVACQHCEKAPCENVCPVAATVHSPEGLNDMVYNRCIGTRYCANNCPYKVRRFNFLDWRKGIQEVEKMAHNPEVTVRMRGVMEKCTYCVQRIQQAKIAAKAEGRRAIRDGEILTACQQTCPAEAIVFGNLNDPHSRVARLAQDSRNYSLLAELNTRPRTTYLAKLRNPNPELEKG